MTYPYSKTPLYTKAFWTDAVERVVSSVLLTALAVLGGDAMNVFTADWKAVGVAAGNVAVLTLVKTILASGIGERGTAGVTSATVPNPQGVGQ